MEVNVYKRKNMEKQSIEMILFIVELLANVKRFGSYIKTSSVILNMWFCIF